MINHWKNTLLISIIFMMAGSCVMAGVVSLQSILLPVEPPQLETQEPVEEVLPELIFQAPEIEDAVIDLQAILARLEDIVADEIDESSELSLQSSSSWDPLTIGAEDNWKVVLKNTFTPDTRGLWYAHIDIWVEGETVAACSLRIKASLFKEVWMVQKRLTRGTVPEESSIHPVMRDIYLERGSPISSLEDLSGYEMVRTVTEGHLLTWNDIKSRPSVRRGNVVEVIVEQGSLTVTMRARSLEDGLLGESIAVKNLASNRELIGTVIGPDKIRFIP